VSMERRDPSRLAWPVGVAAIVMMVGALVFMFVDRHAPIPTAASSDRWNFADVLNDLVNMAALSIGILVATRRPQNPIGWLFLGAGLSLGINTLGTAYGVHALVVAPGSLPEGRLFAWFGSWTSLIALGVLPFLFLLFPTGHLPSKRWRPVAWFVGCAFVPTLVTVAFYSIRAWRNPYDVPSGGGSNIVFLFIFVLPIVSAFLISLSALVVRFRRSVGEERLQLKWFVTAATLVVGTFIAAFSSNSPSPSPLISVLQSLALVSLFSAITVAVLKYRLYEIDVVINKTIVYLVLAGFFTVVYLSVVVGVGTAVGSSHNAFLTVLAAAVIALAFNPVRDRAKKLANRMAYGKRATPYEVLSDFTGNLAGSYSLEDVLPRTARMLAEGTGASRADVWLLAGSELVDEGIWPEGERLGNVRVHADASLSVPGASLAVPVRHQGELLGALSIHKAQGDQVSPIEQKLLSDVSAQAGLVLRNVRLIEDLKASRQRIITAQDQASRRLERDIHDGAQQQLVALSVKLRLADGLVGRDDQRAHAVLAELRSESTDALENLRDLARGIYPPLLADKGLAAALEAQARKSSINVKVESDAIGRYPHEVEAAVYFCCLEALQNIAKYAAASSARVRLLDGEGSLTFEVTDDGRGFDPGSTGYGTGLQGMADRLDALGGKLEVRSAPDQGTTIEGRVPVRDPREPELGFS
jgi:signal transduction histidine kinase